MKRTDKLYNRLCSKSHLMQAWLHVQEKKAAGGIDRETIYAFRRRLDENLETLSDQLLTDTYINQPYLSVTLHRQKKTRELGLPALRDKIVQQAVRMLIEPRLDKKFHSSSYAYRPGKGTLKAVRQVQHIIRNTKKTWLAVCDIQNFFDTVDHETLLKLVGMRIPSPAITDLIALWIKMGKVDANYHWTDRKVGIPQGAVLSPLLSNLYLHQLDELLLPPGQSAIRFADDFIICTTTRQKAEETATSAFLMLRDKLKLTLKPPKIVDATCEDFNFLGATFYKGQLSVSTQKREELLEKATKKIRFTTEGIAPELNQHLTGVGAYYGKILEQPQLEQLDNALLALLQQKAKQARTNGGLTGQHIRTAIGQVRFLSESFALRQQSLAQAVATDSQPDMLKEQTRQKIEKRKREYRKLEASGFEVNVYTPGSFLGKTQRGISVRQHGKNLKTIPVANLRNINIWAEGVSISSSLISFCSSKGIAINFFTFDGRPKARFIAPDFENARTALQQQQAMGSQRGIDLTRKILIGKISNQRNLVRYFLKSRKANYNHTATEVSFTAFDSAKEKLKTDYTSVPQFKEKAFTIEAHAAKAYWGFVADFLRPYTDFDGREHKGTQNLANQMLNYGYAILYSRIWQALIKAKLNPYVGFLHTTERDAPALVYDFIEEFRQQAVDRVVLSLFSQRGSKLSQSGGKLSEPTRKLLAKQVTARINRNEDFRGRDMRLADALRGSRVAHQGDPGRQGRRPQGHRHLLCLRTRRDYPGR